MVSVPNSDFYQYIESIISVECLLSNKAKLGLTVNLGPHRLAAYSSAWGGSGTVSAKPRQAF